MTTGFQHPIQTVPLQVAFELPVVNISDDVKAHALTKAKERLCIESEQFCPLRLNRLIYKGFRV